jgi:2-polyprenyl-3-methyl-5-hydroxy-6-metoxy-1,4-benzoquinol methylase
MERPDRLWDWLARWYDRRAHKDEELNWAVDRLTMTLDADHTVLDLGCASGVVACRIAGGVKQVQGIDTSARMIELANERASQSGLANVRFERTTIFDEKLGRETYDVVLAFHILHLLEDASAALRRISELLKPEGLLVSVTPAGEPGRIARVLASVVPRLGLLSHLTMFRLSDLQDLLSDGGFEVVDSDEYGGSIPTWFAVARKS